MTRKEPFLPPELPKELSRARVDDEEIETIEIPLITTTPIMGGGTQTRKVDHVDVIRAASIRGQLRFWWRALSNDVFDSNELHKKEKELWGGMGSRGDRDNAGVKRSRVEVWVSGITKNEINRMNVGMRSQGAYALWPAREEKKHGSVTNPTGERYQPGLCFTLHVRVPKDFAQEVRQAISAWIIFGGYGGRTRRGAGSLTVAVSDREKWLPRDASIAALQEKIGLNAFGDATNSSQTPSLIGATCYVVNRAQGNAERVWEIALKWVSDFRQGASGSTEQNVEHARNKGTRDERTPGRSNWPEPDKLRHFNVKRPGYSPGHAPRYNTDPAWPRASFGLPISGRFKDFKQGDPDRFELGWVDLSSTDKKPYDRLASPLIVKALPLATGQFVPVALWLNRAFPENGRVVLRQGRERYDERSAAPFDKLVGKGEQPVYTALKAGMDAPEGKRVQTAFFRWLENTTKNDERAQEVR